MQCKERQVLLLGLCQGVLRRRYSSSFEGGLFLLFLKKKVRIILSKAIKQSTWSRALAKRGLHCKGGNKF